MNDGSAAGLIITLVVLLLLSAFFSATETAYTGFSQARMKRLASVKKSAARALKLSEDYNSILSTLLIGNNIVNITAASLATLVFTHFFGNVGVTLSTVVMTVVVLIFGEISPKSLAKERPEEFAMLASAPLYACKILFWPLNFLFNQWKKLLNKVFRLNKPRPSLTEEEFRIIVTDIRNEGVLNETEHELIQKTLSYDDTLVSGVMIAPEQITWVRLGQTAEQIQGMFEETNYSRVPVRGEHSEVKGLLYRADFYELMLAGGSDIQTILRPVMWTSPDLKISALFKRMQREKHHMALVRREREVLGLVTMEDLLEELMGEIEDEYDSESPAEPSAT